MSDATSAHPAAFSVSYQSLESWSVAAQRAVSWHWPHEFIQPLSTILTRRIAPALTTLSAGSTVTLLTIRFDGSIEPRDPVTISSVKGKLFRAYPGDVVFSKIDVRNGAIGLAPDDIECMCVTSEFPVYAVNEDLADPEYVKLLFRTTAFKRLLNSMVSGASGRKRIQPSQLERVKVPIPPLGIQKQIVAHWATALQEHLLAVDAYEDIIAELNSRLVKDTHDFERITSSRVLPANYANTLQWDVKAGRAAAFISANPAFIRLGDHTEECVDLAQPWEEPERDWPIYGVNNRDGVFLSSLQKGGEFNAPYKRIRENWFFHNPTRANVGSLGIVPEVPDDAITSPEYQVWRLKSGFSPSFMALMLKTNYFLSLVEFNRVGGVKQRMYYANLAEIRLPDVQNDIQESFVERRRLIMERIRICEKRLAVQHKEIESMILGIRQVGMN